MQMTEETVLRAIPSTEPADFGEFCYALGSEKPDNSTEWALLFRQIEKVEADGLVEVERTHGKIDTLILTEEGTARVKQSYRR